jgi:hypothetical protein
MESGYESPPETKEFLDNSISSEESLWQLDMYDLLMENKSAFDCEDDKKEKDERVPIDVVAAVKQKREALSELGMYGHPEP